MTKLSWRLSKLPTPSELTELVNCKIITQEEAKDILLEAKEDRDSESLKSEIEFLRQLVQKLSNSPTRIVETIREIKTPWQTYPWYTPYSTWTTSINSGATGTVTGTVSNAANHPYPTASGTTGQVFASGTAENFTQVKTF